MANNTNITTGLIDLPDGSTATTQSASDNSTKVATTAYADTAAGANAFSGFISDMNTAGRFYLENRNFRENTSGGSVTDNKEYITLTTTASSGNYAVSYLQFSNPVVNNIQASNPSFRCSATFNVATNQLAIIGLTSSTGSTITGLSTGPALTTDHAAFLVEDGSLYASVADGSTQTKSSAITATLTDTNDYCVVRSGANYLFYLNGTLEATLSTNIPDSINGAQVSVKAAANEAKQIDYMLMGVEFDR